MPEGLVTSTRNFCKFLSAILPTAFISGSPKSSTKPVPCELVKPTFTEVASAGIELNLSAKKLPSPASGPLCASPPSTNLRVPVISVSLTFTLLCRVETRAP